MITSLKKAVGSAAVLCLHFCLLNSAHAIDEFEISEIMFVTPAKTVSTYYNSPYSVSTLDSELLESLGITTLTDAMRLVPGMVVSQVHGSNSAIGYHGTNVQVPRRTQVLYNSSRIYRSGYADMNWERTPYDLYDIEKIEVVRGTSAAHWGSNAFSSTVNLVQRPIALMPDAEGIAAVGDGGYRRYLGAVSFDPGSSQQSFRLSSIESDGFDESPQVQHFTDSYQGTSALYAGELEVGNGGLFDWNLAGSHYQYEFPPIDNVQSDDPDVQIGTGGFFPDGPSEEDTVNGGIKFSKSMVNGDVRTDWKVGADVTQFKREQNLIYCYPQFFWDPILGELDAAPNIHFEFSDASLLFGSSILYGTGALDASLSGPLTSEQQQLLVEFADIVRDVGAEEMTSNICSYNNQNVSETRYSVFGEGTRSSDAVTLSSTIHISEMNAESETFLNGSQSRTTVEWFNSLKYDVTNNMVANVALLAEYDKDLDDVFFSPRIAVNYTAAKNHIFRLAAAQSRRVPGIHETDRDWRYRSVFRGETDYRNRESGLSFRRTLGHQLEPEIVTAGEIGYTYISDDRHSVIDTKVFYEDYDNLISELFSYFAFDLSNDGEAVVSGFEGELSQKFGSSIPTTIGATLTYLDNNTSTVEEKSLYSQYFGSIYIVAEIDDVDIGLAYYGNSELAHNSYDRFDVNVKRTFLINKSEVELALNYRHYPNDQAVLSEYSSTDPYYFRYTETDRFMGTVKIRF